MDVDLDAEPKCTEYTETNVPTDNNVQQEQPEEEQKQEEAVEEEDEGANADGTEEGRRRL